MGFGLNVSSNSEIRELINKAKRTNLSEADIQKFESIFSDVEFSDDFQIFSKNSQINTLENRQFDSELVESQTLENRFQPDEDEIFSYELFGQNVTTAVDEALDGDKVRADRLSSTNSSSSPSSGTSPSSSTSVTKPTKVRPVSIKDIEVEPPKETGSTAGSSGSSAGKMQRSAVTTETTEDNSYVRVTNEYGIGIQDKDGNITKINFEEITKNFPNQEDKEKLKEILKELPAEILVDLVNEIDEIIPLPEDEKEGILGWYSSPTNKMALELNDRTKFVIAHELGHGIDTTKGSVNGVSVNESSLSRYFRDNPEAKAKFDEEVNNFFDAYEEKYGKEHVWKTSYEEKSYPTEFVATFYMYSKLGPDDTVNGSDWAELMVETMPETAEFVQNLINENREKSDSVRKTEMETYYDNGQVMMQQWTSEGVAYVDVWNEDGAQAYQEQHFEDGTIKIIRYIYDEDGKFIKYKTEIIPPEDNKGGKEMGGGGSGGRR